MRVSVAVWQVRLRTAISVYLFQFQFISLAELEHFKARIALTVSIKTAVWHKTAKMTIIYNIKNIKAIKQNTIIKLLCFGI